jgi:cytoskeletal protein CcmA (bactofilin family)
MFSNHLHDRETRSMNLMALVSLALTGLLFGACLLTARPALAQDEPAEAATDAGEVEIEIDLEPEALAHIITAVEAEVAMRTGERIVVEDTVRDLFSAAQEIRVTGVVQDNAFVAAERVTIDVDGRIEGDLLAAAGEIYIEGEVLGDVYAVGGEIKVAPGGVVHGDMWTGCGELTHDGRIDGHLKTGAGKVTVNGHVGGDADLEVGELVLGPDATIGGDLDYQGPNETTVPETATVGGEVGFTYVEKTEGDEDEGGSVILSLLFHIWMYIAALIVGCVLLWLGGASARRFGDALIAQPGRSVGLGFVMLVVIPVAAIMACVLVLTLQLGLLTGVLYAIALYLAGLITALAIGTLVLRRGFGKDAPSAYAALALGLLLLHLLMAIPFVGFLVKLVAIVAGLGAMYVALRNGNGHANEAAAA